LYVGLLLLPIQLAMVLLQKTSGELSCLCRLTGCCAALLWGQSNDDTQLCTTSSGFQRVCRKAKRDIVGSERM